MFALVNTDIAATHRARPIGGPWSFFNRMRIRGAGQVLEHIGMLKTVHDMFSICSAEDNRYNNYAEGFGHIWEGFAGTHAQTIAGIKHANVVYDAD